MQTPHVTKYASFRFEVTNLLQNQQVEIVIRTIPDPHYHYDDPESAQGRNFFWICGEVAANIGTLLRTYPFTAPIFYSHADRTFGPAIGTPCQDGAMATARW